MNLIIESIVFKVVNLLKRNSNTDTNYQYIIKSRTDIAAECVIRNRQVKIILFKNVKVPLK